MSTVSTTVSTVTGIARLGVAILVTVVAFGPRVMVQNAESEEVESKVAQRGEWRVRCGGLRLECAVWRVEGGRGE